MPNKRLIYRLITYLNIATILGMGLGLLWYKQPTWGIVLLLLGGATLWVYLGIRLATRATTLKIARAQRLERYTHQLFALSKSDAIQSGDCDASLALFSETISQTLGISRISFWTYNVEAHRLACIGEYGNNTGFHSPEALYVQEEEAPRYLAAIREEKVIAAANARLHPLTKEFTAYFQEYNIASMLDVPYYLDSRLAGIICCEHEAIREWGLEEVLFVKSVADLFALVMKSHEKNLFQQELQQNIEELQSSQRQLAELEQQVFKFLNAVPYGVQVIDAQAHSVFVNETGQVLLPILMEELDIAEIQRRVFRADSGLPYPLEAFPIIKALQKNKKLMPTIWWYASQTAPQQPLRYRHRLSLTNRARCFLPFQYFRTSAHASNKKPPYKKAISTSKPVKRSFAKPMRNCKPSATISRVSIRRFSTKTKPLPNTPMPCWRSPTADVSISKVSKKAWRSSFHKLQSNWVLVEEVFG